MDFNNTLLVFFHFLTFVAFYLQLVSFILVQFINCVQFIYMYIKNIVLLFWLNIRHCSFLFFCATTNPPFLARYLFPLLRALPRIGLLLLTPKSKHSLWKVAHSGWTQLSWFKWKYKFLLVIKPALGKALPLLSILCSNRAYAWTNFVESPYKMLISFIRKTVNSL